MNKIEDISDIEFDIYVYQDNIFVNDVQIYKSGQPKFTDRELDIVKRRLLYPKATFVSLAEEYGITKQRAGAIYKQAIKKIKQRWLNIQRINNI